jgi:hypothetical protein
MKWRRIENTIVDHLRRRGGEIINVCGRPHLGVSFCDDADGRELERRVVLDIESLARAIEDNH